VPRRANSCGLHRGGSRVDSDRLQFAVKDAYFCQDSRHDRAFTGAFDEGHATMTATKKLRRIILFAATETLLLTSVAAAQKPTSPPGSALVVTPPTSIEVSGPQGGPFSPSSFQFSLSALSGPVSYSIRTPSWLTASASSGTAGTSGVTITLTVNATAARLSPGRYGPGIAFTNVTNGQGSTTIRATLIVGAESLPAASPKPTPAPPPSRPPPPSPKQPRENRDGYLLDHQGGYLLDDQGRRLMGR
jgi:hypothetical protein